MLPFDALLLDFETFSRVNIKTEGLARYGTDPSTGVHCAATLDPNTMESRLWLPGQPVPDFSRKVIFGWNVQFEKIIWEFVLKWPAPKGWYDIAAHSRYAGCPGKLETACEWFELSDEFKKMGEGKNLIDLLCIPIKTTSKKKNEIKGEFRTKERYPELFEQLYKYCAQDNVAALAILKLLPDWPEIEREIWLMTVDQNEHGCPIDVELCHAIIALTEQYLAESKETIFNATDGKIVSPTQTKALLEWLNSKGVNVDNVAKDTISKLLQDKALPADIIAVLKSRQIAAPASLKKFKSALEKHVNGRLYHNFIYCGGGATGRWSGGGKDEDSDSVQLQNLYRGKQYEEMLDIIKLKDAKLLLDVATALGSNPIKEMQNSVRSLLHAG